MAEETITIAKLQVQTEGAESVGELKENVKLLKKYLDDATIGTEDYQKALDLLKVNQNAVKDAMYATSASLDDVKASATGASESYNSLVHRMADLKQEFRATNDAAKRADLGAQIKDINDQLKDLDALQGNFQRNVGNYTQSFKDAFKGLAEQTDAFGKSLNITNGGINGFKDSFEAFGKSPAIATFGVLVSVAMKLAEGLKDNETATEALKKGMEALKPVMDLVANVLEKVAGVLADVIGKVSEFVTSNGLIQKIINGVMGVGNAIIQHIIAPFKGVIAAIKVFKEEGIKGFRDAADAFGQEMANGLSFKKNFETGKTVAETLISGAKSKKPEVKEAGVDMGKEMGEGIKEGLELADWKKALKEGESKTAEQKKRMLEEQKELDALVAEEYDATIGEIEAFYDKEAELLAKSLDTNAKTAEEKIATLQNVASATSSIFGQIADAYEANETSAEKNANKIKALRIAAATIDTISGAVGAFMQATATIPPPLGQIVGAAQAAAITAAGMAQIAQMRKTQIGSSGTEGTVASPTLPEIAQAPTVETTPQNVRSLTSASEEDRLNAMASDQRVYILSSDIQASQGQIKTQVAESSF